MQTDQCYRLQKKNDAEDNLMKKTISLVDLVQTNLCPPISVGTMTLWSSEEVEVGMMSRGVDFHDLGNTMEELVNRDEKSFDDARNFDEKSSEYTLQWASISAVVYQDIKEGIRVLCEANMIHLDIKPENVIIINKKGRIRANLIDFGFLEQVETRFVADGEVRVRETDRDVSSVSSGVAKYYGPNKIVDRKFYSAFMSIVHPMIQVQFIFLMDF